jgi:hypothetical protein
MNRSYFEALALFVVALVVRITFPEASYFGPDQVGILVEGRGVLQGNLFPPGPGIGWTPYKLGPAFEWVAAIGLLPRDRFSDVLLLVGVMHAAAVVGWSRLFARIGGPAREREARIAGWALALNPMSISSGCAPISTSIVLPTTLMFVWGIVRWVQDRDSRGFVLACVGAAFVIQSHLTATLVLSMFALGLVWKAPIGKRGLFGMLLGAVLAAPMVLPNVSAAFRFGVFQHAGSSGAPYVTALWRALFLEGRVMEIASVASPGWSDPARLTTMLWGFFIVIGAVTVARRPGDAFAKALVGLGFVLPTLCVALIPRGAFFLYFDSTVPFRAWLFANGVAALAGPREGSQRAIGPWALAHVLAGLALVVPAVLSVAHRKEVAELGYSSVSLSRTDLREPLGRAFEPVGIVTLGSLEAIGRALDELGADPEAIRETFRGPWRWVAGDAVGVWIAESRHDRSFDGASAATVDDARKGGDARSRFLVLHDEERSVAPASAASVAGRFRVYRFDDRLTVNAADEQRIDGRLSRADGERVVLQVVTQATHPVARASSSQGPLVGTAIRSSSGFEVWSTSPEATDLTIELTPGERYVEQIRVSADAYAFVAATPERP